MNTRCYTAIAATAILTLGLTACGSDQDTAPVTETVTATPAQATTEQAAPLPQEVTRVIDALDKLEADHTDPEETEPSEISGIDRTFDLDIVDYSAGIDLFANEDDLNTWQEASDDFGGISVTFGTTAVSLNSDEGRDASLALAPQLAEELDGVAHTGGEEPDYTPSGDEATEEEEPAAAQPDSIWAPTGQGHNCPGTDAYVWDAADCTAENLGAEPSPDQTSQYGNESGVDWQDKDTNSDWSDDEVDAYTACMEKYDYNEYAAWNC